MWTRSSQDTHRKRIVRASMVDGCEDLLKYRDAPLETQAAAFFRYVLSDGEQQRMHFLDLYDSIRVAPKDIFNYIKHFYPGNCFLTFLRQQKVFFVDSSGYVTHSLKSDDFDRRNSEFSSPIQMELIELFESVLKTKTHGVYFENLRGHIGQAPYKYQQYVKHRLHGNKLLGFFQKHHDLFFVSKTGLVSINRNMKSDSELQPVMNDSLNRHQTSQHKNYGDLKWENLYHNAKPLYQNSYNDEVEVVNFSIGVLKIMGRIHLQRLIKLLEDHATRCRKFLSCFSYEDLFDFFRYRPEYFNVEPDGYITVNNTPVCLKTSYSGIRCIVKNNMENPEGNVKNAVIDFICDILRAKSKEHYMKLIELTYSCDSIKNYFRSSSKKKLGLRKFFEDLTDYFSVDLDGYVCLKNKGDCNVSCARGSASGISAGSGQHGHAYRYQNSISEYPPPTEKGVIKFFTDRLKGHGYLHYEKLIRDLEDSSIQSRLFFVDKSLQDKYDFFLDHPEIFYINPHGHVSLAPLDSCKSVRELDTPKIMQTNNAVAAEVSAFIKTVRSESEKKLNSSHNGGAEKKKDTADKPVGVKRAPLCAKEIAGKPVEFRTSPVGIKEIIENPADVGTTIRSIKVKTRKPVEIRAPLNKGKAEKSVEVKTPHICIKEGAENPVEDCTTNVDSSDNPVEKKTIEPIEVNEPLISEHSSDSGVAALNASDKQDELNSSHNDGAEKKKDTADKPVGVETATLCAKEKAGKPVEFRTNPVCIKEVIENPVDVGTTLSIKVKTRKPVEVRAPLSNKGKAEKFVKVRTAHICIKEGAENPVEDCTTNVDSLDNAVEKKTVEPIEINEPLISEYSSNSGVAALNASDKQDELNSKADVQKEIKILDFFIGFLQSVQDAHYIELINALQDSSLEERKFFSSFSLEQKKKFFEDRSHLFLVKLNGEVSLKGRFDEYSTLKNIKAENSGTSLTAGSILGHKRKNMESGSEDIAEKQINADRLNEVVNILISILKTLKKQHFEKLVKSHVEVENFFLTYQTSDIFSFFVEQKRYFDITENGIVKLKDSALSNNESSFHSDSELCHVSALQTFSSPNSAAGNGKKSQLVGSQKAQGFVHAVQENEVKIIAFFKNLLQNPLLMHYSDLVKALENSSQLDIRDYFRLQSATERLGFFHHHSELFSVSLKGFVSLKVKDVIREDHSSSKNPPANQLDKMLSYNSKNEVLKLKETMPSSEEKVPEGEKVHNAKMTEPNPHDQMGVDPKVSHSESKSGTTKNITRVLANILRKYHTLHYKELLKYFQKEHSDIKHNSVFSENQFCSFLKMQSKYFDVNSKGCVFLKQADMTVSVNSDELTPDKSYFNDRLVKLNAIKFFVRILKNYPIVHFTNLISHLSSAPDDVKSFIHTKYSGRRLIIFFADHKKFFDVTDTGFVQLKENVLMLFKKQKPQTKSVGGSSTLKGKEYVGYKYGNLYHSDSEVQKNSNPAETDFSGKHRQSQVLQKDNIHLNKIVNVRGYASGDSPPVTVFFNEITEADCISFFCNILKQNNKKRSFKLLQNTVTKAPEHVRSYLEINYPGDKLKLFFKFNFKYFCVDGGNVLLKEGKPMSTRADLQYSSSSLCQTGTKNYVLERKALNFFTLILSKMHSNASLQMLLKQLPKSSKEVNDFVSQNYPNFSQFFVKHAECFIVNEDGFVSLRRPCTH